MKNPAQVLIPAETIPEVQGLLQQVAVAGSRDEGGLQKRSTFEYFVVRGNEKERALLMGARDDNTTFFDCRLYEAHQDHPYTEKWTHKIATSRTIVCTLGFKQNVGHFGKEIAVAAVHASQPHHDSPVETGMGGLLESTR